MVFLYCLNTFHDTALHFHKTLNTKHFSKATYTKPHSFFSKPTHHTKTVAHMLNAQPTHHTKTDAHMLKSKLWHQNTTQGLQKCKHYWASLTTLPKKLKTQFSQCETVLFTVSQLPGCIWATLIYSQICFGHLHNGGHWESAEVWLDSLSRFGHCHAVDNDVVNDCCSHFICNENALSCLPSFSSPSLACSSLDCF